jgi:hypothetical protein
VRSGTPGKEGQTTLHTTRGPYTFRRTGSKRPMCLRARGSGEPEAPACPPGFHGEMVRMCNLQGWRYVLSMPRRHAMGNPNRERGKGRKHNRTVRAVAAEHSMHWREVHVMPCRWEFKAKHFDSLLCFKMVSSSHDCHYIPAAMHHTGCSSFVFSEITFAGQLHLQPDRCVCSRYRHKCALCCAGQIL